MNPSYSNTSHNPQPHIPNKLSEQFGDYFRLYTTVPPPEQVPPPAMFASAPEPAQSPFAEWDDDGPQDGIQYTFAALSDVSAGRDRADFWNDAPSEDEFSDVDDDEDDDGDSLDFFCQGTPLDLPELDHSTESAPGSPDPEAQQLALEAAPGTPRAASGVRSRAASPGFAFGGVGFDLNGDFSDYFEAKEQVATANSLGVQDDKMDDFLASFLKAGDVYDEGTGKKGEETDDYSSLFSSNKDESSWLGCSMDSLSIASNSGVFGSLELQQSICNPDGSFQYPVYSPVAARPSNFHQWPVESNPLSSVDSSTVQPSMLAADAASASSATMGYVGFGGPSSFMPQLPGSAVGPSDMQNLQLNGGLDPSSFWNHSYDTPSVDTSSTIQTPSVTASSMDRSPSEYSDSSNVFGHKTPYDGLFPPAPSLPSHLLDYRQQQQPPPLSSIPTPKPTTSAAPSLASFTTARKSSHHGKRVGPPQPRAKSSKAKSSVRKAPAAKASPTPKKKPASRSMLGQELDCEKCGKSFARPYNLKTHMDTHSGKKKHTCPLQGCTHAFSRRHDLRRHLDCVHEPWLEYIGRNAQEASDPDFVPPPLPVA